MSGNPAPDTLKTSLCANRLFPTARLSGTGLPDISRWSSYCPDKSGPVPVGGDIDQPVP